MQYLSIWCLDGVNGTLNRSTNLVKFDEGLLSYSSLYKFQKFEKLATASLDSTIYKCNKCLAYFVVKHNKI